jgi:hypothetical protein
MVQQVSGDRTSKPLGGRPSPAVDGVVPPVEIPGLDHREELRQLAALRTVGLQP